MGFRVSPGVTVREFDLTQAVRAASGIAGAFAGKFRWGPVLERVLVSDEEQMKNLMGAPNKDNYEDFLTAASFLAYTDTLRVVRVGVDGGSQTNASDSDTPPTILNDDDYDDQSGSLSTYLWIAKYPGSLGNGLSVALCETDAEFQTSLPGTWSFTRGDATATYTQSASENISEYFNPGDFLVVDNSRYATDKIRLVVTVTDASVYSVGETITGDSTGFEAEVIAVDTGNNQLTVDMVDGVWVESEAITSSGGGTDTSTTVAEQKVILTRLYGGKSTPSTIERLWQYGTLFGGAPADGKIHVAVVDTGGEFSGVKGTVIESYDSLSLTSGAKYDDGSAAYYVTAINRRSDHIRVGESSATGTNYASKVKTVDLTGGADDFATVADADYLDAYDKFVNPEEVDAPLLITGARNSTVANYVIQNIAEVRKDSVAFVSPEYADVVNNAGDEVTDTVAFRNSLPSSSYAFLDSGWKYMYDRYNDTYRWVPLNGDIAGLVAATERDRDAWYSPAGFNRGKIKNVVKLAYSPDESQRDVLYQNGINPVTDFPGDGVTLYGDKTLLATPSAFDRINVRRLFIVVEKAIANAAKYTLFEFNDEFTRAQFVSSIEPFLREVKGRRGITNFKVVADETVNTPQVIDNNEFRGQIFLKPNRSINFIMLDFAAVRTGVSFEEVVGQF